jgi:ankyrin repeat protein
LRLACGDDVNDVKGKEDLKKVKQIISQYPSLLNEAIDLNGKTPLILASYWNYASIVEFLLSCDDLDVNKRDRV